MINLSIDTETTGLIKGVHEIVSIAFLRFDDNFNLSGPKFISYIKPERPSAIDPKALMVNGLTMDILNSAPAPHHVRRAFLNWKTELFGDEKIMALGHNYSFDKGFLEYFIGIDEYNAHWDYHYRDSFVLAQAMRDCGKLKTYCSLNNLAGYFHIEDRKAHTAEGDAECALKVYKGLLELIKG